MPLVVGLEQTGQSQAAGGVVKLLHARLWQAGDGGCACGYIKRRVCDVLHPQPPAAVP